MHPLAVIPILALTYSVAWKMGEYHLKPRLSFACFGALA
jgi:hypothetical protein